MRSILALSLIVIGTGLGLGSAVIGSASVAVAAPSSDSLAPVEFYYYINADNDIMGVRGDGSIDNQGEMVFDDLKATFGAAKIENFGFHVYLDRGAALGANDPTSSETFDTCTGEAPRRSELGETDSTDPKYLRALLEQHCYPNAKRFVVIWSHGDGYRVQHDFDYNPDVKNFHISQLLAVIPDGFAEAVIFDSCSMASLEVASLLTDKAKWTVSSQFELPNEGIQYGGLPVLLGTSRETSAVLSQLRTDSEKKFDEIGVPAPLVLLDLSHFQDLRNAFVTAWEGAQAEIASDYNSFRGLVLRGQRDGDLYFFFEHYAPGAVAVLGSALESGRGSLSFALPRARAGIDLDMQAVAEVTPEVFQFWSNLFPNWSAYANARQSTLSNDMKEGALI